MATQGRARFTELAAGDTTQAWSIRHSCPVWLVRLLREELGAAAAESFLAAANGAPERCLRVNTLRRMEKVSDELAVIQAALDRITAHFEDAASDETPEETA